jgi:hypothetical protein
MKSGTRLVGGHNFLGERGAPASARAPALAVRNRPRQRRERDDPTLSDNQVCLTACADSCMLSLAEGSQVDSTMDVCNKCGDEVTIRTNDGGKRVPYHFYGKCIPFGRVIRFKGEAFCRPTKCTSCGNQVFFVRHNGGSVWFDDLGWPWPKHPCYAATATKYDGSRVLRQMGIIWKLRIGGQRTMLAIEGLNTERYCIGIIRAEPREDLTGSLVSFDDSNLTDMRGGCYKIYSDSLLPQHLDLSPDWITSAKRIWATNSPTKVTVEEFEQDLFARLVSRSECFDFQSFAYNFRRWLCYSHLSKKELEVASERVLRRLPQLTRTGGSG